MYKTLSHQEKLELLNQSSQKVYKMVGHSFTPLKGVGKQYCTNCGLVALRNKFTDWCVDKGCYAEYHPQYKNARKRYTGDKL